jgi:hypothetical protein
MLLHDWTRVKSGTYHHFHYYWLAAIGLRLNSGLLPPGLFAMVEQRVGGPEPDVVTLSTKDPKPRPDATATTVAPSASTVEKAEKVRYARKTNRIAIHHDLGNVIAVIELVSPGNKDTKAALRSFAGKSGLMIRKGIHLLVIDPFPPGRYDPEGIHPPIWRHLTDTEFKLPETKRRTIVSYQAGEVPTAYVEPIALGEPLPDRPLFLDEVDYVSVPLEETYQSTWNGLPVQVRELLEPPLR